MYILTPFKESSFISHKWFPLNNVTSLSLSDIALLETAGAGIGALCGDSETADHNKEPSSFAQLRLNLTKLDALLRNALNINRESSTLQEK